MVYRYLPLRVYQILTHPFLTAHLLLTFQIASGFLMSIVLLETKFSIKMTKTSVLGGGYLLQYQKAIFTYQKIVGKLSDRFSGVGGGLNIRKGLPEDNEKVRHLIQQAIAGRGRVGLEQLYDTELTDMYEAYQKPGTFYSILTFKKEIIGMVAVGPMAENANAGEKACEIRKFFMARGYYDEHEELLITHGLEKARSLGYRVCYFDAFAAGGRQRDLLMDMEFEYAGPESASYQSLMLKCDLS